jgi:fibronectin type 3 domain-containing protein
MFGKKKWLSIILLVLLCFACDLENGGKRNIPIPPINVRAVAVSSTSIQVSWNPVSGISNYNVYYKTGSMPLTKLSSVSGTSYTHMNLQSNTAYEY